MNPFGGHSCHHCSKEIVSAEMIRVSAWLAPREEPLETKRAIYFHEDCFMDLTDETFAWQSYTTTTCVECDQIVFNNAIDNVICINVSALGNFEEALYHPTCFMENVNDQWFKNVFPEPPRSPPASFYDKCVAICDKIIKRLRKKREATPWEYG